MASSVSGSAVMSSGGSKGSDEPDPKRRRLLLDAGGLVEDDETAKQKMRDARVGDSVGDPDATATGFDPDNLMDRKNCQYDVEGIWDDISPMGYFARDGDLKMMRWLYAHGADTRDEDVGFWFPMYAAANRNRIDACKWLYDHGASKDVSRRTADAGHEASNDLSPLQVAFWRTSHRELSRWLILRGALCKKNSSCGELDIDVMRTDLDLISLRRIERKYLLEWANGLHGARAAFLTFMTGALTRPKHAYRTRRESSPLRVLGGTSGILELIGECVGILRGREARIIRQLTELLPGLNAELDAEASAENDESEGDEESD